MLPNTHDIIMATLENPCLKCGVEKGSFCQTPSGRDTKGRMSHKERYITAAGQGLLDRFGTAFANQWRDKQ